MELRLTVNFVVGGVVRNFEASGLTFRSNGNPTIDDGSNAEGLETVEEGSGAMGGAVRRPENARYFPLDARNSGFRRHGCSLNCFAPTFLRPRDRWGSKANEARFIRAFH